jgi:threonine/homoserine efflux transporter RhtA
LGVVWLRLLFGSIALSVLARPELRGRPWRELRLVLALGRLRKHDPVRTP